MKIAILGARGIPACYSGYDTLVEHVAVELSKCKDIQISVYCRASYYKTRYKYYKGVKLIYLPAPRFKAIESLFHSLLSSLHVLTQSVDVIYFLDPANAPFCAFLRIFNKRVIIHTDGLGWKRTKWGFLSRQYYKWVEWVSAHVADALITDNPIMKTYYENNYNASSFLVSYGASDDYGFDDKVYMERDINFKNYLLVVARLEPENNTELIIKEYVKADLTMPLIIVGDAPYNSNYYEYLKKLGNNKVKYLGRINNQSKLNSLYKGAFLYIHGHEVGGTNPSLLRAMNAAATPLVININFNLSVIEKTGYVFNREEGDLSKILKNLVIRKDEVKELGENAKERANKEFSWDQVVNEHRIIFMHIRKYE